MGEASSIYSEVGALVGGCESILLPHAPKDSARQPNRREEWAAEDIVVEEMVNLTALRAYSAIGSDRRNGQLLDFIKYHEEHGGVGEDGMSRSQQVYTKKLIAGAPFGRRYARKMSLRNSTFDARVDARDAFCEDIDFSNSPMS